MSIHDYVAALQSLVATTPFIMASSFSYEERPPSAALVKGTIHFLDGSRLDLKEFLITQPTLYMVKYGYHYRKEDRLIFRYDNANDPAARHLPTFPHHKHIPLGLLAAEEPSLEQVLREIVSRLRFP